MHRRHLLTAAATATVAGPAALAGSQGEETKPEPLPVSELWERPVIGRLGVQLGRRWRWRA